MVSMLGRKRLLAASTPWPYLDRTNLEPLRSLSCNVHETRQSMCSLGYGIRGAFVVVCDRTARWAVATRKRGTQCARERRLTLMMASLTMSATNSQQSPANIMQPLRSACDEAVRRNSTRHTDIRAMARSGGRGLLGGSGRGLLGRHC